jgi:O-antigen/teichoic acid export membrane protein
MKPPGKIDSKGSSCCFTGAVGQHREMQASGNKILREPDVADVESSVFFWPKYLLRSSLSLSGYRWFLTLIDQCLVSGATFLASIIIGRNCGKEQLGLYLLGLSIIWFLTEWQGVIIWWPYTIFHHKFTGSSHSFYTGSTLIHQLAISALGMIALSGAGVGLSMGIGPAGLAWVIWILVITSPFIAFREYARRILFANFQIGAALLLDFLAVVVQIGGLVLFAYLGNLSASSAFVVLGLGSFLTGFFWLVRARDSIAFSIARAVSDLAQNWSFGKWFLGANMALLLSSQFYPWVLNAFHGTAPVGVLAACQGMILVHPFMKGSANFIGPRAAQAFAQGGNEELRRFVAKSSLIVAIVVGLVCGIIMGVGEQILIFFYGQQYAGNGKVVAILALNTFVLSLAFSIDYGIVAMGRPDYNFKINLIRLGITFTFGLWLVKAFGLLGAVVGLLVGNVMASFMQYSFFASTKSKG